MPLPAMEGTGKGLKNPLLRLTQAVAAMLTHVVETTDLAVFSLDEEKRLLTQLVYLEGTGLVEIIETRHRAATSSSRSFAIHRP